MCITQHTTRSHLTQEDRVVIEALHAQGATLRTIATYIYKHHSTVSREVMRNCDSMGVYTAQYAQKMCTKRRLLSRYHTRKIENTPELEQVIVEKLQGTHVRGDWSPDATAHSLGSVSHQTIYSWIRRSRPDLRRILPRHGKYRRQYGARKVPKVSGWMTTIRSIDTRPEEVELRTTCGHLEGDTIVLERGVRSLMTLADRKSKFLFAELVSASVGISYAVHEAIVTQLLPLPVHLRQTITPDRGSEFSYWDMTEKEVPGLTFYFAHAHSPWERGTNEHSNGLLRRYFPKGEKHATITQAQVTEVVWMINHRPRKSLNWKTPCQVFGGCCVSD